LSFSADTLKKALDLDILSSYVAAQEAVKSWKELPTSIHPTFIYTGNCTNVAPIPGLLALSVGKSGSAAFIAIAAAAYKETNYKFYFADQRLEDGSPLWNGPSAVAHAELFLELAEGTSQGPWLQTFVEGIGYKKFHDEALVPGVNA
jgi:hypothetical protein